jgi:hypothetical protein
VYLHLRMRTRERLRALPARLSATLLLAGVAAGLGGCGSRGAPLPDLAGPLAWVVVESSLAGEPLPDLAAPAELLLDSVAFPRLGVAAGGAPLARDEVARQVGRPIVLVDPRDVLECPSREPCRVRGDAMYLTVWDAVATPAGMSLVVNRVFNVQGLYRRTTSVTHLLELRRTGTGWQLAARTKM